MADIKQLPIIETHYEVDPRYRPRKRWIMAIESSKFRQKKSHNLCVEAEYHRIVNLVRSHYLKPGEVYFERDHKTDTSDGLFGMHTFLTPSFYLWLECNLLCDYKAEYAFNECDYELAIRKFLRSYPLDRTATERILKPDFETYYQTTLRVQDKKFVFTHL